MKIPNWIQITGIAYGHGVLMGIVFGGVALASGHGFWPTFAWTTVIDGLLVAFNLRIEQDD